MNEKDLLAAIGVSESVLAYFDGALGTVTSESLFFRHGIGQECPIPIVRYVLSSNNWCWTFGQKNPALVTKVIVCTYPLEALSWLHFHHMSCNDLDQLLFVATGNIPGQDFYKLILERFKSKKILLVLGGDLLGRVCDIKVATQLMGKECSIKFVPADQIVIKYGAKEFSFAEGKLSLNSFETATGIRSGIRTYKPKDYPTYFKQLAGSLEMNQLLQI